MLDSETYDQLKHDIEYHFEIAKKKHDEELAALELLWKSHGNMILPVTGERDGSHIANGRASLFPPSLVTTSSLVDGIKEAIISLHSPFTRRDIMNWLSEHRKELRVQDRDVSVATALSRMVGTEIKVSEPGAGRRLAKYVKVVAEDPAEPRLKRPLPSSRPKLLVEEDSE